MCLLNTRLHSIQPKTHSEVLIGDTTTTTLSTTTTMQRTAGNRPLLSGALCSEKQEEVLIKARPGKNEDFSPPANNLERAEKSKADSVFDRKSVRIQTRMRRFLYFVAAQSSGKVEHWLRNHPNWLKTVASVQLVFAFVLISSQQEPLRRSFITLFSGKQQQHGSSSSEQTVPV